MGVKISGGGTPAKQFCPEIFQLHFLCSHYYHVKLQFEGCFPRECLLQTPQELIVKVLGAPLPESKLKMHCEIPREVGVKTLG